MKAADQNQDIDPQETREWQEAVDVVIEREGSARAQYLIKKAIDAAYAAGAEIEQELSGLRPNTRYFYRMLSRRRGPG